MSSERYTQMMHDKKRIEQQVEAEFAFGELLEAHGTDPVDFIKQWKLSHHQFNTLAHDLHGVNDKGLILPPTLRVLLGAAQAQRAA